MKSILGGISLVGTIVFCHGMQSFEPSVFSYQNEAIVFLKATDVGHFVFGYTNGDIVFRNSETGENLSCVIDNTRRSVCCCLALDESAALVRSCKNEERKVIVEFWDLIRGKFLFSIEDKLVSDGKIQQDRQPRLASCRIITSLCVDFKGLIVVTGDSFGSINFLDMKTKKSVYSIVDAHKPYSVDFLSLTNDRKYLVSASFQQKEIKIFDKEKRMYLKSLMIKGKYIETACLSSDETSIVVASRMVPDISALERGIEQFNGNIIAIFDIERGCLKESFICPGCFFSSLCTSLRGDYIVAGSFDGAVIIIDVTKKKCIKMFKPYNEKINVVTCSHDYKRIFSASKAIKILSAPECFWAGEPFLKANNKNLCECKVTCQVV